MNPDITIIVPVYNEEKNIEPLYRELDSVLAKIFISAEIIFINDGSTDGSLEKLQRIHQNDSRVIVIDFRRNFGQTASLMAGFDLARGKIVITLDGDGQNDPADISKLLQKIHAGFDVISGWRAHRQEPALTRRWPSSLANKLISRLTGLYLHDYGCSLKAYRANFVKEIRLYGEMHRFIPALCAWNGARVTEVAVNDRPRKFGHSKYNLSRTGRVILDLFTVKFLIGFSTRPIQIFGRIGIVSFILGLISLIAVIVLKLAINFDMSGNPLLILGILFILVGIQFVVMGLLAEINIRTYHESQDKKIYKIRQILK